MSENETPSPIGAKKCLWWLNMCKEIGWHPSHLPALADLFWKYRDRDGNLIETSPQGKEVKP